MLSRSGSLHRLAHPPYAQRSTTQSFVYTIPSRKAQQAIRDRTRWRTRRSTLHYDVDQFLPGAGRSRRGWANYFRHGVSSRFFSTIDYHAWLRIGAWIRGKHGRPRVLAQGQAPVTRAGNSPITRSPSAAQPASRSPATRYRGARIPTPWTILPELRCHPPEGLLLR
jgi:RNA-directed DNA polymerase